MLVVNMAFICSLGTIHHHQRRRRHRRHHHHRHHRHHRHDHHHTYVCIQYDNNYYIYIRTHSLVYLYIWNSRTHTHIWWSAGRVQGPIGARYTGYANAFATTGEAKGTHAQLWWKQWCKKFARSSNYLVDISERQVMFHSKCQNIWKTLATPGLTTLRYASPTVSPTRPGLPGLPALGRESWGPTKGSNITQGTYGTMFPRDSHSLKVWIFPA